MHQTTTPTPAPRTPARSRTTGGASVAARIAAQRRTYARAVLRSLAATHRGRPAAQIQPVLRHALTPLGVRLSQPKILQLAADISAGRPVTLT